MKVTIIGGAGFIGCNAAEYYAKRGHEVTIFDNLARKGSESNLNYLTRSYPGNINFTNGDITNNFDTLYQLPNKMKGSDLILHLAAQVAVTTSVKDPRHDFDVNALGTFNTLEALRKLKNITEQNPIFIYSSTNKVYGEMEDKKIIEREGKYDYEDLPSGISETEPLDFHSPYGCSKGTGDQYVRDYSRIYDLNTIVFRQSCIYGKRQFGVEDQGWVAWFTIANVLNKPVTIFGDGKQVRDVLWVDDLVNAYELARQNIEKTRGQVYNIGGGPKNRLSLLELISLLENESEGKMDIGFSDCRPGDQKICIMDITKANKDLNWQPTINPEEGVKRLYKWVVGNKKEIKAFVDS